MNNRAMASLSSGNVPSARVACVTNEGRKIYLMLGEGDGDPQRWQLSHSLARKLYIELHKVVVV